MTPTLFVSLLVFMSIFFMYFYFLCVMSSRNVMWLLKSSAMRFSLAVTLSDLMLIKSHCNAILHLKNYRQCEWDMRRVVKKFCDEMREEKIYNMEKRDTKECFASVYLIFLLPLASSRSFFASVSHVSTILCDSSKIRFCS